MTPGAIPWTGAALRQRVADYVELTKLRVVSLVLVTTAVGYYLGARLGLDHAGT